MKAQLPNSFFATQITRPFVTFGEEVRHLNLSVLFVVLGLGAIGTPSLRAQFVLVDNFETHTLGAALTADADWKSQAGNNPATGGTIVNDGGSKAARILGGSNNGGYYTGLGTQTIADNTTGTAFFRFRSDPAAWLQIAAYLTDWQPNNATWYNHDEAGFYSRWNQGDGTSVRPQWNKGTVTNVAGGTWYNVWIVANNTTNTFDLHMSQGTDGAVGGVTSFTVGTGITFRTSAGDLDHLMFMDTDGNSTTGIVLDDIYVDKTGANLANPVASTLTNYYWDGPSGNPNGASDGGTGTWNTSATNWDTGASVAWSNGTLSRANFGGAAGIVTLAESSITADGLLFASSGYTLSAANSIITGPIFITAGGSLTLDTSGTLGIASAITGTNSTVRKTGDGTLSLSSTANAFGVLTVDGGKVTAPTGTVPTGATVTVNTGGTLSLTDATYAHVPGTLNIIGGTVSIDGAALNAHNYIGKTITMQGGTLTSVNGVAGPANDGGYGNFILNNSTLVVSGSSQSVISCTTFQINTGGGSFAVDDAVAGAGTDLLVSANISGGALVKNGAGTMELTGTNTYGGNTIVNGGTLKLGASGTIGGSPSLTVATGATLDMTATTGLVLNSKTLAGGGTVLGAVTIDNGTINATGGLSVTSLAVAGFGTLNITPGSGSLTVTGTNGLDTGTAGNLVLVNVGTTPITSGTYPLVHYQGAIQGDAGAAAIELGTTPGGDYTYELVNSGTSLDLVVLPLAKLWTGASGSDWTTDPIALPKNWKAGLNPSDFVTGDEVLFDDSSTNATITISGADVNPGSVLFSNLTNTYTLQGPGGIAGATTLVKTGGGTVAITNTNSFAGAVSVEAGTLAAATVADGGFPCALGSGTEILLEGGTLSFTGGSASTNRLVFLGTSPAVHVAGAAATIVLTGEVSGGALTKTGAGTLGLGYANSYSGVTRVNEGTVEVASLPDGGVPGPLGASSNAAANLVLAGGTLAYNGPSAASNRGFTLVPSISGAIAVTQAESTLSLSGPVAGAGTFVKSGPGTLVRTAAMNSYARLVVGQGKLAVATASYNGLSFTAPVTIESGGTLSAENATDNAHNLGVVTLNGGVLTSINGPAGPANDGGFGNWVVAGIVAGGTSPSTVSASSIMLKTDGTSTIEVADVTGSPAADLTVSSSIMEDGVYSVGCQLIKAGDGTLSLSGVNTYTGNTTVNAGTLVLADGASLAFAIKNTNGISNKLTGSGSVVLDGDFSINTAAVTSLTTGTWLIEDNTSLTGAYGPTFSVVDPSGAPWTNAGNDKWTRIEATRLWTFDETTGTLTLEVAAGFSSWIGGFGLAEGDRDPGDDPDHDGVPNLVEYALAGRNPALGDGTAGSLAGGLLGFTKRADATGITLRIEESDDLGLTDPWTEVSAYAENSEAVISYSLLPATGAEKFARLAVTLDSAP
ncbi:MAG: autotransporter-associated beta strand repeat-containing protein [Verrucomicrobia bacterium]|nr:autotransporter-associated beta strand repeat-containing protein [Verrucomicrobiota bacterium]